MARRSGGNSGKERARKRCPPDASRWRYACSPKLLWKLRHRSPAVPASVVETEGGFELHLDEPAFGVALGQAAVLYAGETVVGSGVITAAT